MSDVGVDSEAATVLDRIRGIVWGTEDPRVRATWRVLLAWPIFWILAGGVLAGNLQAAVPFVPGGGDPGSGLAQSVLHAGFVLVALVPWARHVDRQPLSNYGMSAAPRWALELAVGFVAVLLGFGTWFGLGAALGETAVAPSVADPEGSLLLGLVVLPLALVIHAGIQQLVFFRVILKNAAEGLHGRGVAPSRALLGALPVAVLLFVAMHGLPGGLRALDLAVAGGVFGLLYLHTGDLALGTGVHFGALYGGNFFDVTGSLLGVLGTVGGYGFPRMVVAYLLLLAWLKLWRGEVALQDGIVRWTATH